jgi:hypothetical protein
LALDSIFDSLKIALRQSHLLAASATEIDAASKSARADAGHGSGHQRLRALDAQAIAQRRPVQEQREAEETRAFLARPEHSGTYAGLNRMKPQERHIVEGTEPTVYIGHRVHRNASGAAQASASWYAEYCLENRQRFEALKTPSRAVAIRKAHDICARIRAGQPEQPKQKTTVKDVVDIVQDGFKQNVDYFFSRNDSARNALNMSDDDWLKMFPQ